MADTIGSNVIGSNATSSNAISLDLGPVSTIARIGAGREAAESAREAVDRRRRGRGETQAEDDLLSEEGAGWLEHTLDSIA